jgi:hypothetical protein
MACPSDSPVMPSIPTAPWLPTFRQSRPLKRSTNGPTAVARIAVSPSAARVETDA